jgi:hypothetical protein
MSAFGDVLTNIVLCTRTSSNLFPNLHVLEEYTSNRFQSTHGFDVAMMDFRDSQQVLFA